MGSMFSKIVVGTDGSKSSHLAVRRAAGIAAAFGSELVLASAYFAKEADAQASRRDESSPVVGDEHAEEVLGSGMEVAREEGAEKVRAVLRERSEEHTSELQSRFDLVCRLLLEKKK